MTSSDLEVRLALQEGRAEITDLIHRYSYLIRLGRAGEVGDLFTQDGTYEMRESAGEDAGDVGTVKRSLTGRPAIADFLASTARSGIRICPFIHNVMIEIDGDRAVGNCLMESRTWPAGHDSVGEYRDNYRREGTSWLFESRVYTRFECRPARPIGA